MEELVWGCVGHVSLSQDWKYGLKLGRQLKPNNINSRVIAFSRSHDLNIHSVIWIKPRLVISISQGVQTFHSNASPQQLTSVLQRQDPRCLAWNDATTEILLSGRSRISCFVLMQPSVLMISPRVNTSQMNAHMKQSVSSKFNNVLLSLWLLTFQICLLGFPDPSLYNENYYYYMGVL